MLITSTNTNQAWTSMQEALILAALARSFLVAFPALCMPR